jgi:hypothetical protein
MVEKCVRYIDKKNLFYTLLNAYFSVKYSK